ncbi:MAG: class I SAM-dependent methyltransferase [Actinomycetota bacterium]|nr:class I SAM-dependent methyltransferase [Actinomycetota bacterium]
MHRDQTTDLSMLERLVAPAGKDVVDIGCGGGSLVRQLAGRGARVIGLEISAEQLAPALARAEAEAGTDAGAARYLIGRAQALPVEDASVDVAVFMRTLHHVSPPELMQALREARRVLRSGGVVYIAEPLTEGDFYALTTLVENELEVRRAAEAAIADAAHARLERIETVEYEVRSCIAGLAALRARIISADPARATVFDAREAELAEAFNRLGEPGEQPGERCFLQPMRADVLRAADA